MITTICLCTGMSGQRPVKSGVANLRRRLVKIGDSMEERIDKLVGGHRNRNHYQNVIQARNRANFAIGEQGARRNDG